MIYSLDSNTCIAHLRSSGSSLVSQRLAPVDPTDARIPSIVVAELLFGAAHLYRISEK